MKKLLALAFALIAVSAVQAATIDWKVADTSLANMNYAIVDSAVITALQNGQEFPSEEALNAAVAAGIMMYDLTR